MPDVPQSRWGAPWQWASSDGRARTLRPIAGQNRAETSQSGSWHQSRERERELTELSPFLVKLEMAHFGVSPFFLQRAKFRRQESRFA